MTPVAILTGVLVVAATLAIALWRVLHRTGGLERYFWSAAVTFFLFEDVSAHHAAVVAAKIIPFRRSRDNISAALISLNKAPDTLFLLILGAAQSAPIRNTPLPEAADVIRRRAAKLATSIGLASNAVGRFKGELSSVAPEYAEALFTSTPRPQAFSKLDAEAVKRIHTFFTS